MVRFSRVVRHWFVPLIAISVGVGPLVGQSPSDDGRYVHLRIETDRASYRTGDSISLRIAFTNTGATPIRYVPIPAWVSSRLKVTDDGGRVVVPTSKPTGFSMIRSIQSTLLPGATRLQKSDVLSEWADLRRWGYDALRPGRYSIEGAPLLVVVGANADTTLRSNRVTITVEP
jgi:hypothetical protein